MQGVEAGGGGQDSGGFDIKIPAQVDVIRLQGIEKAVALGFEYLAHMGGGARVPQPVGQADLVAPRP